MRCRKHQTISGLLAAAATSCSIVADSVHDLVLQVKDSQALYRSDFFPGLGWMTTQQVWQGLRWVTLALHSCGAQVGVFHGCVYAGLRWVPLAAAFMWGSGGSLLRLRLCGAQVGYSCGCVHVGLRWVTLAAA